MNKHLIDVILCVGARNPFDKSDTEYLLSPTDNNQLCLPHEFLDDRMSKEIALELMKKHTGVTEHWVMPTSFGVIDNLLRVPGERTVAILYGIFIPEKTRIRVDGDEWYSYDRIKEMKNEDRIYADTIELIYETIWR